MSGSVEADLLLLAVHFVTRPGLPAAHEAAGDTAILPRYFQVDGDSRTVFIGRGSAVEAMTFAGEPGDPPEVATLGPAPAPAHFTEAQAAFLVAAAAWIHADVTFNETAQLKLLSPDARCFGAVGPKAIVAGNMALSKTIRFGMPHPIVVDYLNAIVTWDFDVIPRQRGEAAAAAAGAGSVEDAGRGTDVVHIDVRNDEKAVGLVARVDTLRHQPIQPPWVRTQICDGVSDE
mmetsp:Transcript_36637/g.95948  ORF Transcript_36637/g.95948 Transcript_36637/m.95948 type:complete len:232 (+) Transcript_36637:296-991(+)